MKFTREMSTALFIRRVSAQGFQIDEETYADSIALTAHEVLQDWPDKAVDDLQDSDFDGLLQSAPEVILLGTGASNLFPPRDLVFAMARRGIGFETMDTMAAARTFNVLAGEGRSVAAVLYLP